MTHDYLSKAKVLIVDDEPANVRLLERILALAGCHHVRCTTDPRQALALSQRGYVLENGRVVLASTGAALLGDAHVKRAYLGL